MSEPIDNDDIYTQAVYLASLIYKSREKASLTEEEQRDLSRWLNNDASNRALFDSLLDRVKLTEAIASLKTYDTDRAVTAVFGAIGEQSYQAVPRWHVIARRGLAAAMLVLAAGIAWRYFIRQDLPARADYSMAAEHMTPGGFKAMLILSDGRKIVLDSLHTGSSLVQGDVRVEQHKDGLVYVADGAEKRSVGLNTLSVPRGAQYHVVLADHSEAWLNAASSITYPACFTGNTREVSITGEAYFRVADDKTKPFFVSARDMKVQVLGTEFDIMAYPEEKTIRATLIRGAVKASNTDAHSIVLKPGEQASLIPQSKVFSSGKVDLDEVLSWRKGEFSCHDTDMPSIMRQIARWYDVVIDYRGSVDDIQFNGQLSRKEKIEDLLDILSDTRKVHFEIKGSRTIIVIPGPR